MEAPLAIPERSMPYLVFMVEGAGFEPAYRVSEADLQSAAFNHSATPPRA